MKHARLSWSRAVLLAAMLPLLAGFVWGMTSAFASNASPSPSNGKVVLRLGWLAGPDNLNPFIGTTSSAFTVWYMNYDTLVGLNTTDIDPEQDDRPGDRLDDLGRRQVLDLHDPRQRATGRTACR
jgi:ABC-type transport system substrate-binding protein